MSKYRIPGLNIWYSLMVCEEHGSWYRTEYVGTREGLDREMKERKLEYQILDWEREDYHNKDITK